MKIENAPTLTARKPVFGWTLKAAAALLIAICAFLLGFALRGSSTTGVPRQQPMETMAAVTRTPGKAALTDIYAHNVRLHQGPDFRVYIQWLRGQMRPSAKGVTPSFDDPVSFYLNVTNGVIRVNIGDVCNYLNAQSTKAPLRNIKMSGAGNQVTITGTLHKLISLPVELKGVWEPSPNNRIQLHVEKINVLKIPFKGLLGGLHVTLSDVMGENKIAGMEVSGNDIFFDPGTLMPPPHIQGLLTKVTMASPDIEAVYGDAAKDVERVEQWRNFLRLRNGALKFGKLTMREVDLIMVDISQDAWFDLDLANYQAQLVNGYTRITPEAGLQVFMPDVSELSSKSTNIPWLKNRNAAPPTEVIPNK